MRQLGGGGRQLSWRGAGGGKRGHTLLPRLRAGVHTVRGLASLIERSKSHNNSYNSHNYDPRDTSSKKLEISLYVYFDFSSLLPVNFTFYVYFDFTSLLPCHSCTYFNQNKCVQSKIERRGLLVWFLYLELY